MTGTDELHDQLREIAATASIDVSSERDEIERRARRYRRHRRRVALAFAALGVTGTIVVLSVLASGGEDGQSVRVPPAQSGTNEGIPTTATPVPDPTRSVDECLAQAGVARGSPEAGTINVADRSLGNYAMDLRQFCTEKVALVPPTDAVTASFFVDGGHVRARYFERIDTTQPDGGVVTTQGRELTPAEVDALFSRASTTTTTTANH